MILLLLIFILSLLPYTLLYLWIRGRKKGGDSAYRAICSSALKRGAFLSLVLTLVVSSAFYIIEVLLRLSGAGAVTLAIYHSFIVFALAEELVKYFVLQGVLRKNSYPYSWLDITSLMIIIGIGFGMIEAVFYAAGANAGMMLTRGITAMHGGYGFIMGYFIGKGRKSGRKRDTFMGILIPVLLHGAYDCGLCDALGQISDRFAYASLALATASIVVLIGAIVHIRRAAKNPRYTDSLTVAMPQKYSC
jgi:RsiW-degrading membrane proteinase PrsW (M82 family)